MPVSRSLFGFVVAVLVAGCATISGRVPVQGPSVAGLVGDWDGTYESRESGRHGTILFRLHALADTAQGAVFIESRPADDLANAGGARRMDVPRSPSSTPLFIRIVFVEGNLIRGVLEPYRDPQCGCLLTTTFQGRLDGNRIEGTFRSEGEGFHHLPSNGEWQVRRIRH
jgi:hypothetical protein